jgi:hypothetical protein
MRKLRGNFYQITGLLQILQIDHEVLRQRVPCLLRISRHKAGIARCRIPGDPSATISVKEIKINIKNCSLAIFAAGCRGSWQRSLSSAG